MRYLVATTIINPLEERVAGGAQVAETEVGDEDAAPDRQVLELVEQVEGDGLHAAVFYCFQVRQVQELQVAFVEVVWVLGKFFYF